jgi:GntR family transcriptional regulator
MPTRPRIPPPAFPRPPSREHAGSRADAARWVRDVLRSQIMEGAFGGLAAARPPMPSEPALAAQLGVSRNAIREALDLLRDEGLITRVQGAGTFVTGAKLRHHLDRLEGLAESMAGYHLPVENRVLSVRESVATVFVAGKLAVPEGSRIAFVERLRSVGGLPLSLDTSSLRPEAIPVLLGTTCTVPTSSRSSNANSTSGWGGPRSPSRRSPPMPKPRSCCRSGPAPR